jgi:epoxyqueuosine reductase
MNPLHPEIAFDHDEKYTLIPISRLQQLKDEITHFKTTEQLNGFQRWIVDDLYSFELPDTNFTITSILLIAVPHPLYSHVTITHGGKKYPCLSLVSADFEHTKRTLETIFQKTPIQLIEARNLPLKRLAVHSTLAIYGRNNITYIEGLGSNFSYSAYFTNLPCPESTWVDVQHASRCATCTVCLTHCPTGAIQKERFLINNQICLACLNEVGEPFPAWLPKSVHHTLYDCLQCQIPCPLNKDQLAMLGEPIEFDEHETDLLLAGARYEMYPETMQKKARYLGLNQWPDGIAKNLKTLIEYQNEKP